MDKVLIVANGCFSSKEVILEEKNNKTTIALDGAAERLLALGIIPDVILGDFDSINIPNAFGITKTYDYLHEEDPAYRGLLDVWVVPAKDQLHTDLTKAIFYCDQQGANSITIICGLGGRLDHHEGTIRSLRRFYRKERPIWVQSDSQTLFYVKDDTVQIKGAQGDKCGVLAFPEGSFSSQGLRYEAHNFPLDFGYSENICNEFAKEASELQITGEALIILPRKSTITFLSSSKKLYVSGNSLTKFK